MVTTSSPPLASHQLPAQPGGVEEAYTDEVASTFFSAGLSDPATQYDFSNPVVLATIEQMLSTSPATLSGGERFDLAALPPQSLAQGTSFSIPSKPTSSLRQKWDELRAWHSSLPRLSEIWPFSMLSRGEDCDDLDFLFPENKESKRWIDFDGQVKTILQGYALWQLWKLTKTAGDVGTEVGNSMIKALGRNVVAYFSEKSNSLPTMGMNQESSGQLLGARSGWTGGLAWGGHQYTDSSAPPPTPSQTPTPTRMYG